MVVKRTDQTQARAYGELRTTMETPMDARQNPQQQKDDAFQGRRQTDIQLKVLAAAVRALIKTHPHPTMLRSEFDTLMAGVQTQPQLLHSDMQHKTQLRQLANDLFETK